MKTSIRTVVLAAALSLAAAPMALAQVTRATPGAPEARTAIELMPAKGKLTVTSPAFEDGGDIPFENTQYRGNVFPGLSWTPGPAGTKSYVLIMQDNDLIARGAPILHWTMVNIPAGVTRLAPGMTEPPAGAAYGPNYKGAAQPYTGPRTPPGPKDHYHFEIFALDATVPVPVASYAALTAAMKGHILASGEIVGLGEKDPAAK
jgi:para-nitrobenzyl esterase